MEKYLIFARMIPTYLDLLRKWKNLFLRVALASFTAQDVQKVFSIRVLPVRILDSKVVQRFPGLETNQEWFVSETTDFARPTILRSDGVPALGFTRLSGAEVSANPRHSGVIHQTGFLLEPSFGVTVPRITVSDPPVAGQIYYFDSTLLTRVRYSGSIERAVYVGSRSPHNWYHWIIDNLPAVYLSRFLPSELSEVPLLIPEEAIKRPDWMEMLNVVSPSREIVPFPRDKYVEVKDLTWVHSPTIRREPEPGASTPLFAMESHSMLAYRKHVLDHFTPRFSGQDERTRIFLARDQSGLRPYNQAEILRAAGEFGFSPLYLESMGLSESMEAIANAEYVIGPHGAAWGSALFARSARAALIWTWDQARVENWFHNVLGLQGIRYQTIFTGPGDNSSPYTLSPDKFRKALIEMLNHHKN